MQNIIEKMLLTIIMKDIAATVARASFMPLDKLYEEVKAICPLPRMPREVFDKVVTHVERAKLITVTNGVAYTTTTCLDLLQEPPDEHT